MHSDRLPERSCHRLQGTGTSEALEGDEERESGRPTLPMACPIFWRNYQNHLEVPSFRVYRSLYLQSLGTLLVMGMIGVAISQDPLCNVDKGSMTIRSTG